MRLPEKPQPYVGIVTRDASPELSAQLKLTEGFGLVVEEILPDSPAKQAGLQRNDLITQFDDQHVVNPPQLEALIRRAGKDKEATLTILRGGAEQKVTIRVGEKMLPERRALQTFPGRFQPGNDPGDRRPDATPRRNPLRTEADPEREGGEGSGERRVRYAHSRAHVVRSDADGRYELLSIDGARTFIAQRPDGTVAWTGPIETAEQKQSVPAEYRKKLEMLEQGIVAEPAAARR